MNFQHVKYFRAVALAGSYSNAAKQLYITQPALSRAIAALEDELGFPLFEKNGRSIFLTPCGQLFLSYVEKSIDALEQGIDAARLLMGQMFGTVSVACTYGYVYNYLPQLVQGFLAGSPHVRFSIAPSSTYKTLSDVSSGSADIGIVIYSPLTEKYRDLEYMLIQKEPIVVITSKKHPFAQRSSCRLAELAGERMVSFGADSGLFYRTQAMFECSGLRYDPHIKVTDDQSVINIVKSDIAVALVLQNTVQKNDPDITILEIEDSVDKMVDICLCVMQRACYSAAVSSFVEYILSHSTYKQTITPTYSTSCTVDSIFKGE